MAEEPDQDSTEPAQSVNAYSQNSGRHKSIYPRSTLVLIGIHTKRLLSMIIDTTVDYHSARDQVYPFDEDRNMRSIRLDQMLKSLDNLITTELQRL